MAAVTNQATLRTTVADWLNRSDLTNAQLDQFIEMGEAKVYELLRAPALEKSVTYTIAAGEPYLIIPSDFLELIEIRATGGGACSVNPSTNTTSATCVAANGIWTSTSNSDDTVLTRTDTRNLYSSDKHSIANSFARDGAIFVVTDSSGNISASGTYVFKYYKLDNAIGSLYTNGETFRSTSVTCGSLLRQSDGAAGAAFVAYSPANGYGTCTINYADVEKDSWLLGDYEMVLYGALSVASEYLGNDEDAAKFTRLFIEKITATNMRANNAELKGANVQMRFQGFQGL
jgi:hypothetical protein